MSKKRLGKLAKMTEEQKLLYMEKQRLAEEEMRRDKEELLAQYLKNKLAKEEKISQENWHRLNYQWREILREAKSKELKKEIEILSQVFERAIDIKNCALQSIIKDLSEAEEQFLMAKRSHIQNVDKLMDFQKKRIKQMDTGYGEEVESLMMEFDIEKLTLVEQHKQKVMRLENIIFAMEETFFEKDGEAKAEFQSNMDELKNRNLEEIHTLRLRQESLLESLWNKFLAASKTYHEATEERKKGFDELKDKDDKNTAEIKAQMDKIEKLQLEINKVKIRSLNSDRIWRSKNNELKSEKDILADSLYCLKKKLSEAQTFEKERMAKLISITNETQKKLKSVMAKGEHLLKAAERCRKLESEREKVLPFYESSLNEAELKRIDEIMAEETNEKLSKLMHHYTNLDNFWKRFNKAAVEKAALEKEMEHLTEINRTLKHHIKCSIKEHFAGPDVKLMVKAMSGDEQGFDCGLPELKIISSNIADGKKSNANKNSNNISDNNNDDDNNDDNDVTIASTNRSCQLRKQRSRSSICFQQCSFSPKKIIN